MFDKIIYQSLHFIMKHAGTLNAWAWRKHAKILRRKQKIAMDKYKYWEPETVIVEAKASGLPLTDELRSAGIPVVNFTPSRGNDKHVRVNSVAPMFESGQVWCPDERWAQDVIEECAAFPFGDHDDYVDSTTQALMRYRQGNFVQLPDDYYDEPRITEPREYY